MKFNNIIGHSSIKKRLKKMVINERVPHALLFYGAEGIGKRLTAFVLGAMINCQDEGKEKPCLKCLSCKRFKANSHPLIKFIGSPKKEPEIVLDYGMDMNVKFNNMITAGKNRTDSLENFEAGGETVKNSSGGSINKTVKINIDQIRELKREACHKPYIDGKKVFIIDDVASASREALNGILKILEEPPESTFFILITSKPQKLLPTIHSRCQKIEFSPLTNGQMEKFVNKSIDKKLEPESRKKLINISGGSPGKFIKFLEVEEFISDKIEITKFFKEIGKEFSDRQKSLEKLNVLLKKEGHEFRKNPHEEGYNNIKLIEQAIQSLNRNSNTTLTVANMFLKLGITDIKKQ
ncbi:MAG: ATP-binding protein [Elusimicrobiota bacterium]